MDPSDILGALQRTTNIKQNQLTLQEIAGLREDLRRKEAEEAAAPKCPYCAGAISNGVAKCRHCTSEVQWCEVEGKAYVLTAEEVPQYFVQQKLHELAWEKQQRAEAEKLLAEAALKASAEKQKEIDEMNWPSAGAIIIFFIFLVFIIAIFISEAVR
ncbi:MAG: hypothetical protein GY899_12635 [Verrucomicrobiaceae bacterium]|nr:hypothetical protein [Verrucomicrobiaceae bacterium]